VDNPSVLDVLPESLTNDIKESLVMINREVFAVCFAVCEDKPPCVPARSALFKQYIHMAYAAKDNRERMADQAAKCERALKGLRGALVQMDPIRRNWYNYEVRALYGQDSVGPEEDEIPLGGPPDKFPAGAAPSVSEAFPGDPFVVKGKRDAFSGGDPFGSEAFFGEGPPRSGAGPSRAPDEAGPSRAPDEASPSGEGGA
jgi:hypothetical protein